jgi:hypothetical protein
MVESKEEALVKEERWPEATPTTIPPSDLPPAIHRDPYFVFFCVSLLPDDPQV